MPTQRRIGLDFTVDDSPVSSETTCVWVGPYVLAITTLLTDEGFAVELHSTFVGHTPEPTHVTHLMVGLGPRGRPLIMTTEHPRARLDPEIKARECVDEHLTILVKGLASYGYQAVIDAPDDAFDELERVEL